MPRGVLSALRCAEGGRYAFRESSSIRPPNVLLRSGPSAKNSWSNKPILLRDRPPLLSPAATSIARLRREAGHRRPCCVSEQKRSSGTLLTQRRFIVNRHPVGNCRGVQNLRVMSTMRRVAGFLFCCSAGRSRRALCVCAMMDRPKKSWQVTHETATRSSQ
jgi:hypothetical protein